MNEKPGMFEDLKFTIKFFLPLIVAGGLAWLGLSLIFWMVMK